MKYSKPCVRPLGDAVRTIRADNKEGHSFDGANIGTPFSPDPAYDLDE